MNFWRQSDIISPDILNDTKLHIIGVGGIGSPTTLALAKMGCSNITVYDPDIIEDHNLPNQIYKLSDIDRLKVDSLEDMVNEFSGTLLRTRPEKFSGGSDIEGIVISGVDSMESRKEIWDSIKGNPNISMYIDGRMGAELCTIYTTNPCDPDNVEFYEGTLYSDEEAEETPCTRKAIIYNVFMIAALIASQVKKHLNEEDTNREIIFDLLTLTLLKM